jgi:hypothetical protein
VKLRGMLLGCALLFGSAAFAQDDPKLEIPVGYSYARFTPENSNIVTCPSPVVPLGVQSCSFSLNGIGGGVAFYFKKWLAIAGDFQRYGSNTKAFIFPLGKITECPGGCTIIAQGNLLTYNALVIAKMRKKHFEPFFEGGFGGAYTNLYSNLYENCVGCVLGLKQPGNTTFDFIVGGGIDIPLARHIALRPGEFDFLLTRFSNVFTRGYPTQNNFRYVAGVVVRL